jgi:hypothetical protein
MVTRMKTRAWQILGKAEELKNREVFSTYRELRRANRLSNSNGHSSPRLEIMRSPNSCFHTKEWTTEANVRPDVGE